MAPQNAANTLWAFAALGELDHTDAIMESVGAAALRHAARRRLTPQGLANTCWALAVFDVLDAQALRGLVPALKAAAMRLEHRAWTQVFLAELAARSSSAGSGSLRPVLPPELLEHAEASWRRRNPPGTEKWCLPVAMALDDLGLTGSIQEAPPGNGELLQPDFVLELSGQRLALQVDGPPGSPIPQHTLLLPLKSPWAVHLVLTPSTPLSPSSASPAGGHRVVPRVQQSCRAWQDPSDAPPPQARRRHDGRGAPGARVGFPAARPQSPRGLRVEQDRTRARVSRRRGSAVDEGLRTPCS